MINISDVKALRSVDDDLVALVLPPAKVDQLHALIGKTRHVISTLPDKDLVLKVDFKAEILSKKGDVYMTHLKVGRLRTRIDAEIIDENGKVTQSVHFWPMWNDEDVEFESLGEQEIAAFVEEANRIASKDFN